MPSRYEIALHICGLDIFQTCELDDTMALSKTESDIFANKTNILLAKSQRQIASWLPPRTARDKSSVQLEEETEDGEEDFSVAPEVYVMIYGQSDAASS